MRKDDISFLRVFMKRRSKRLLLIVILISMSVMLYATSCLAAEEDVWNMIEEGEHGKALDFLEAEDIERDIDLRFARALLWSWQGKEEKAIEELYRLKEMAPGRVDIEEQLIRVLGWQRRFEEAEQLGEKIMQREESDSVMALLAVQAEWQQNWELARTRWQRAAEITDERERREEYLTSVREAEVKLKTHLQADMEAAYLSEETNQFSGGLRAQKWLDPGLTGNLGIRLDEMNLDGLKPVFSVSARVRSPILPPELTIGGGLAFRPLHDRRGELNLGGGYEFAEDQILGIQIRGAAYPFDPVIDLTPEYTYRGERISATFANTLRIGDDLVADFSQRLQLNFPGVRLRPGITALRFFDNTYQLQFHIDLEDEQLNFSGNGTLNPGSVYLKISGDSIRAGGEIMIFSQ